MAYRWSVELVRPENRNQINEKYKSKIENIARRPNKDEIPENKTECPYCKVKKQKLGFFKFFF